MKTLVPWLLLVVLLIVSIFELFGFNVAGWGDPITSTDLFAFSALVILALSIEIREAANYVVEKTKR